ncbi:hypothetical protein HYS29_00230 [Candidatus Microgenomates bacterium]|nr:hypothetical protein [Candidatus Microgenomates bacterium]
MPEQPSESRSETQVKPSPIKIAERVVHNLWANTKTPRTKAASIAAASAVFWTAACDMSPAQTPQPEKPRTSIRVMRVREGPIEDYFALINKQDFEIAPGTSIDKLKPAPYQLQDVKSLLDEFVRIDLKQEFANGGFLQINLPETWSWRKYNNPKQKTIIDASPPSVSAALRISNEYNDDGTLTRSFVRVSKRPPGQLEDMRQDRLEFFANSLLDLPLDRDLLKWQPIRSSGGEAGMKAAGQLKDGRALKVVALTPGDVYLTVEYPIIQPR